VGAGLLTETVRQLTSQPLGFDAERLVVTSLRLPPIAGMTAPQRAARIQVLVDRLAAEPGIQNAAATSSAPFSGSMGSNSFQIPGRTFDRDPNANRHIVSERYFDTLGIRPLKGRVFDATDRFGAHAAVVTDEFERVLMEGDALGKRFVLNGDEHTIVGVVPAPKHRRFSDQPSIAFYALSRQLPMWATPTLMARTAGDPEQQLSMVRQIVTAAEPHASFVTLETMTAMTRRSIADERYRAQLAMIFAGMAVFLSAIGLYGLVTSVVNERRREMGIRMALGARPAQVRGLVLIRTLRLVGGGVLVGVPAALSVARGLASFLFGVPPTSPTIVLIAVCTIATAALLAALGPALRASRINPTDALRTSV
jgi:predicted permease